MMTAYFVNYKVFDVKGGKYKIMGTFDTFLDVELAEGYSASDVKATITNELFKIHNIIIAKEDHTIFIMNISKL